MGKLYTYRVTTNCKKFANGENVLRTYEKMHDARTKDNRGKIACAAHFPPCVIILKLMEEASS